MTTPDTYLGRQFAAYGDGWPAADHADAMACRDLEAALAYGLTLYQFVMQRDGRVAARLEQTGAAYDLPAAKEIESLLRLWLEPAAAAEAQIAAMESKGFTMDRAAEFRAAVFDARISTSITAERAAAICERIARDGLKGTATTEDIRRELRNRMGR